MTSLRLQEVLLIRLLLFGAPGLVDGPSDSDIHTLQPKRAAVLAYLMVARSGPLHRRDTLLAMFWPEYSADRGRNALSKVIHHLRRSLGPDAILIEGDQIGIAREHLWCDVTAFEEALADGRPADALALYRGDLLDGFHISGSSDFDHWSEVERSRLRRSAVASAWELVTIAEEEGDGVRATKFARQAVEFTPRDESGLRRLLTLLQRRGDRAQALEVFETFSRNLRRDYEIEPSAPTLELVEAIRDGSLPSDLVRPSVVAVKPAPSTPEVASLDTIDESTKSEAQPDTHLGASGTPPNAPRTRRRLVAAASVLAIGLLGVLTLSSSNLPPLRGGDSVPEIRRVLVTDFEDRTDEDLATVVTGALRVDLSQSRSLDLVERADVVETLGRMGLESSATLSSEVGREVALRDGLEAFVDGAVARAGTGYIITAAIRTSGDRTIASFREAVDSPEHVIAAIDRLSLGIREALGENADTIGVRLPLERVTTPSLEALTLYTRAVRAFDQFDDRSGAASLLQRAVALDPGFAMAWRMLSVTLQNEADQSLRLQAISQAYQHRDRLSELERYMVEASYHGSVGRDRSRAVGALLKVLAVDPEDPRALNNLGIHYLYMGEPERAEEVFGRATRLPNATSGAYRNLVDTRVSLGWIEEASSTLDEFERGYPDHALILPLRARLQFLAGEVDDAKAGAQQIIDDPLRPAARRADASAFLGRIAYWEGRHEEARDAFREAERIDAGADEARVLARVVEAAHTAALVGDVEWARSRIEAGLQSSLPDDVILGGSVIEGLTEVLVLVYPAGHVHAIAEELASVSRFSSVHARISRGDTLGVRSLIGALPLHLHRRVLLFERLADVDDAIELYEEVRRPGYTGWGSAPELIRASMRLGPLYEEAGDTARAIKAYRAFARQWADGDSHGQAIADRFNARAQALEKSHAAP